jgi:predicted metal-binding protein
VGYTTCGGCPGGNIEYAPAEMKKNGAQVIHLATGMCDTSGTGHLAARHMAGCFTACSDR